MQDVTHHKKELRPATIKMILTNIMVKHATQSSQLDESDCVAAPVCLLNRSLDSHFDNKLVGLN